MSGLDDLLTNGDDGPESAPSAEAVVGGMSNAELMTDARAALSGNWGMAIVGYVLYTILSMCFSFFVFAASFFVGIVAGLSGGNAEAAGGVIGYVAQVFQFVFTGALVVGFFGYFLGLAQSATPRLELLFVGFRRFWKSFAVYFLYSLFILLWTLLFIIPGIIASFSYAMAFFIVADDEECGALEAIKRSKNMMHGHRWKFFCLHWRFLGWALLCIFFTCGIGFLWLAPYMQTSFAKFYEDVKAQV